MASLKAVGYLQNVLVVVIPGVVADTIQYPN